ncbi:MAG: hypothetical protein WA913_06570 [Pricia sp.]
MKKLIGILTALFVTAVLLLTYNCKDSTSGETIVGRYESVGDTENQKIEYHITHIKENIYGIKVDVSFDGTETQTDYLEGSFNPEERILTTKRSNVVLNYQFSPDYSSVKLLGDENEIMLERR